MERILPRIVKSVVWAVERKNRILKYSITRKKDKYVNLKRSGWLFRL